MEKVLKCDFKPGSVEWSIDRYQREVYLSKVQAILSISSTNKNRAVFPVGIKTRRPFFKFDSVKEILKA
jgi:hypothetical protein